MTFVPLFHAALRLQGRGVLVVGADTELERRVEVFKQAGARVRVISGSVLPPARLSSLNALDGPGSVEVFARSFQDDDLLGCWIATLVNRDLALAARIAEACEARCVFFCAVDQPLSCSFFQQAVARCGQVTAAFSTAGQAPGLAGRLKREMEGLMQQAHLSTFVSKLADLRRSLAPDQRRTTLGALIQEVRLEGELVLPHAALQTAQTGTAAAEQIERYSCSDDGVFPGSDYDVLVYRAALPKPSARGFEQRFALHGWTSAWRNGLMPVHHCHTTAHEVLGIYRGRVSLRLGGEHGPLVTLQAGDACVVPAGVAHKNEGQTEEFGVVGAYPEGTRADTWLGRPEERRLALQQVRRVPLPTTDPLGGAAGPLLNSWAPT